VFPTHQVLVYDGRVLISMAKWKIWEERETGHRIQETGEMQQQKPEARSQKKCITANCFHHRGHRAHREARFKKTLTTDLADGTDEL
jgi:hypothetical protein